MAIFSGVPLESQPEPPPIYAPDFLSATGAPTVTSGVWTALNNQPSFFASAGAYLLTDGRVLVEDAQLTDAAWWTLTPDNTGSYINGSWAQVASPGPCPNGKSVSSTMYAPLYYASAVLADGRFVMIGGEYDYNYTYVNGSGEVWTNQGAIYDPVANSWTCIAPPAGWTEIGDAQSAVLSDGTFMIASPFNNQVATLNASTNPPTFNAPFIPAGKIGDSFNDEEGWILLPDGDVFTTEVWNSSDATVTPALTYSPVSKVWSSAGIAPDPLVLLTKGGTTYDETGPAMLRPDGTVFASGAVGFNDIYDTVGGTWSSGPSFPTITGTYSAGSCNTVGVTEQLVAADAPAALLPDGNVLIAPGPVDSQKACEWVPPTEFFEFDGTNLTQVAESTVAPQVPSFVGRLLVLPTGQVLYTNSAAYIELYTPAGSPNPSWAPTIATSPATVSVGGTNYAISGTQFNGLSQASSYGDDFQAATNFPLVRITNNGTGHVFYARTHSHSTMAVATGSATVSTEFDVPGGVEGGASTLVVVANGIASSSVAVNVLVPTPTATATATPSVTATPTASRTATTTATATQTKTATSTATATPTASATATATATATGTATATPTMTATATRTATATSTATATPTATSTDRDGDHQRDRDCDGQLGNFNSDDHCDCNSVSDTDSDVHGNRDGDCDCNVNLDADSDRDVHCDCNRDGDCDCNADRDSDCNRIGDADRDFYPDGDRHSDCDGDHDRHANGDCDRVGHLNCNSECDADGICDTDRVSDGDCNVHCDGDCYGNCNRVGYSDGECHSDRHVDRDTDGNLNVNRDCHCDDDRNRDANRICYRDRVVNGDRNRNSYAYCDADSGSRAAEGQPVAGEIRQCESGCRKTLNSDADESGEEGAADHFLHSDDRVSAD